MNWKQAIIESVTSLYNTGLEIFNNDKTAAKNYVIENSCANKNIINEICI